MKHLPRSWKLGYPETIYALMNVGRTWWKATQKVREHYLHLTQCMLPKKKLNGHHLIFCSPDSYNPRNSCWNKHCYIIMRLSVVCHSCIGCRSVWLKGTPNGSEYLQLSHYICYCKNTKHGMRTGKDQHFSRTFGLMNHIPHPLGCSSLDQIQGGQWTVSLIIVESQFNVSKGYVWVCTHTNLLPSWIATELDGSTWRVQTSWAKAGH